MSAYRKKLIEVALPLEAINAASAREKSIRHGHPSTLHLWWARRPLAAARAILFAQLVDDPSSWPELFLTEDAQNHERQRLFRLIADLVIWENSNNESVINSARLEIARSHARSSSSATAKAILALGVTPEVVNGYLAKEVPPVHDPFAGGGTIPLEAQRLGIRAIASDLNPVAVMINKALIELPTMFGAMAPVNPQVHANRRLNAWRGAEGLADDIRYYGAWIRDEAKRRIGHLYPDITITDQMIRDRPDLAALRGRHVTVIAYLWARTVSSPNPAMAGAQIPLLSSFWVSSKDGQKAWLEPLIEEDRRNYRILVRVGNPHDEDAVSAGTKLGRGANFRCLLSGIPIEPDHIKAEGKARRLGARLTAIVAEGDRGRVYLSPTETQEAIAASCAPPWVPEEQFAKNSRHMTPWIYGLESFGDLFTTRQLVALNTFSDLIVDVGRMVTDAAKAVPSMDAEAYGRALAHYLAFAVDKMAEGNSAQCTWSPLPTKLHVVSTFGRQALQMVWDYAEANIFGNSAGTVDRVVENIAKVVENLPRLPSPQGLAMEASAVHVGHMNSIVSTDPPYYDNVPYADLSDFFYVWMRRSLREVYRDDFSTVLTPKDEEVIAEPFRTGGDAGLARDHFEKLLKGAFETIARNHPATEPVTIYYAFKQSETESSEVSGASASTGWETMLEALLAAGFTVEATWPVRTEKTGGYREMNRNALASSIVLVCRKRLTLAPQTTRGDFRRSLRRELPDALRKLQQGNLAPVDVAQASIGPGMAIFSRHKQVSEADGSAMTVRNALQLINEVLDEYLSSGEGDFDADTRFAITWYEQHGWEAGSFGDAENLAKARNVSVNGVVEAGICHSAAGKVRILKRPEMRPLDYDPTSDDRPTVWEFTQHMIRYLEEEGEEAAARLLRKLGSACDATRELAYRLYNTCERKKWAEDARSYNALILAWPELEKLAAKLGDEPSSGAETAPSKKGARKSKAKPQKKGQQELFEGDKK